MRLIDYCAKVWEPSCSLSIPVQITVHTYKTGQGSKMIKKPFHQVRNDSVDEL